MATDTKQLERRNLLVDCELRAEEDGGQPPKIVGYASRFGVLSEDMGGWRERVKKGAFKRTLAAGTDIRALADHDSSKVLGRNKSGTLRLKEDAQGLYVEIDPPDTQLARDLMTSIRRGDVSGMSIGFYLLDEQWKTEGEQQIREVLDIELLEVSVVTFPAFPDTTVAVRSLAEFRASQAPTEDPPADTLPGADDAAESEALRLAVELEAEADAV